MEAGVERVERQLHLPTVKPQTVFMLVVLLRVVHVLVPQVGDFHHRLNAIKRTDCAWMAVASVLTFRLLTYWLPILPGYLSLRHLRGAQLL